MWQNDPNLWQKDLKDFDKDALLHTRETCDKNASSQGHVEYILLERFYQINFVKHGFHPVVQVDRI